MTLKEYFIQLTSNSELVSSKRVIALLSFLTLVGVIVTNLCGATVPEIVYYTLFGIITGNSVMTLFSNKGASSISNNSEA